MLTYSFHELNALEKLIFISLHWWEILLAYIYEFLLSPSNVEFWWVFRKEQSKYIYKLSLLNLTGDKGP